MKAKVIVDILVMGWSMRMLAKTKARVILCINQDTLASPWASLLGMFYELKPVQHLDVPARLASTQMNRLKGVYSKIKSLREPLRD